METETININEELVYSNDQLLDDREEWISGNEENTEYDYELTGSERSYEYEKTQSELERVGITGVYDYDSSLAESFAYPEDSEDVAILEPVRRRRDTEFEQAGWLNQHFFETCCQSCCFPVRRIDLSRRNVQEKIGRHLVCTDIPPLLIFLGKNPDIVTVNLEYNDIGDAGFINLIEYARKQRNIFGLNMSYNKVTVRGMVHMMLHVDTLNIKSLQLRGNELNAEGVQIFTEFVQKNPHLVDLDLADVGNTVQSLSRLINVLNPTYNSCNVRLKMLDISRPVPTTGYYVLNSDVVADWTGRALKHNTRLLGLGLQKYNLSCHDIETLMMGTKYNKTLVSLDLGCNNIGDLGVQAICEWLSTRPALKILSLTKNIITDHGARSLGYSIPSSKLLLLDVSYNRITDDGMVDILNSLKKTPQLQCLKIFGNRISDPSARIVHRMLLSKVLRQESLDVRVWSLDNRWYLARYESTPCQLKYFLQPCCQEKPEGCPTKATYSKRYLKYTRVYSRIADDAEVDDLSKCAECKEKPIPEPDCSCCACLKAEDDVRSSSSSQISLASEASHYLGVRYSVFKEMGSNKSVRSLNLEKSEEHLTAPILRNVSPELREKIRRWIDIDEDTLEEDLKAAESRKEAEEPKDTCNFQPVTISAILQYLEEEPANILLIRQDDIYPLQHF